MITSAFGLPMWLDLIIEYIAGFSFGLFIFQSLFMKKLMGGTYWQNVRSTFLPEFISMNAMMAAMAPVMVLLMMGRDMRAMEPWQLLFWGVMSIGVMAGFSLAYPFNVWMVQRKMKHGLMTVRASNAHSAHEMHGSHGKKEHQMGMSSDVTFPQKAAVTGVASFMVVAGMVVPSGWVNLNLGTKDVGGLIMPPGMVMPFDTPAETMREMAAVLPSQVSYEAPADARGDQVLQPKIENGVKVFDLEASVIKWHILPNVTVDAYAYNHQIPGPRLALTQGDHVRINVTNHLPESTTVHWHGLILPNEMDGAAEITQKPIEPGKTFTYDFTVSQSGTYYYHTHEHVDRQQALGLYGALIIAPKDATSEPKADIDYVMQLQEWLYRGWLTYPAMPMEGAQPNFFTINGKAYPSTDTISMKVGQTVKIRFIGTNTNSIHPMHIHGGPFQVVAVDGNTLPEQQRYFADTVNVGPGQRYDVIWTAQKPGKWLIHCHIPHHTENNNVETEGGGGLMMIIDVKA